MNELKKTKLLLILITAAITALITFVIIFIITGGWSVVSNIQFNAALVDSVFYGVLAAIISLFTYWSVREQGHIKKRLFIAVTLIIISTLVVVIASILTAPSRLHKQTTTLQNEKQRAHTALVITECDGMSNMYWSMCINNTLKTPSDYSHCVDYQKRKLHDIQLFVCVNAYADNTKDISKCQLLKEDYLISGCEQTIKNNNLER